MNNKKSVTKNYIYNLSYQLLIIVLPIITTPYLSKVLGAENIGIYSYTLSIVTYFILFGSLGIGMYGQREIAYLQESKEKRSVIFWEIVILKAITMFISMIAYFFFVFHVSQYQLYYKILILEMIATCFEISWFFQGLEEFKKTVTRNLIIKIISVICIFMFVKTKEDLIIYFFIYLFSGLLGNISLWFYLPKYLSKINIKDLNIIKHIKPVLALFIPQIAIQIYTVLDKTMIGNLLNDMEEVGNYEQSQKIIKLALTVVTSLSTVVSPRIANTAANNKKGEVEKYLANSFNFVWFLGIPITFGIMAISDKIVPWFLGSEFNKSITLLKIGAPLILAIGLNNVSGIQYLISTKKQNKFTLSVVIGAIFNFFINLMLIPSLKSIGAILASVLAETLIFFIQLIIIRKELDLRMVYHNCFKNTVCGLIMYSVTFFIGTLLDATMMTTIIQILVGVSIYFGLLLICKDKILYQFIEKIKLWGVKHE